MTDAQNIGVDPPPTMRQIAEATITACPQARALNLESVSCGDARAIIRLPYDPVLVGDPDRGVIAGGAVTTLLDHTCGQAVWAALLEFRSIATLDLRIDYLRSAAPGCAVLAHAHCYRLTRSIAFVRAQAYDADPADPIAAVQAAFMLDSDGGRAASADRHAAHAR